jgi:hypothetical protein
MMLHRAVDGKIAAGYIGITQASSGRSASSSERLSGMRQVEGSERGSARRRDRASSALWQIGPSRGEDDRKFRGLCAFDITSRRAIENVPW